MQRVIFDFDVVSPYVWLAFERLPQALEGLSYHVEYRPLLLGAVLQAWDSVAPVDIAPKKAWLYRQCAWLAARDGIEFALPRPHPFSSLALLRLLVASAPAGQPANRRDVERVLRHVWARGGADATDASALARLAEALAPQRDPQGPEVKAELRERTEAAVRDGVFGVPFFRLDDGQAFWGQEALPMLADALRRGAAVAG